MKSVTPSRKKKTKKKTEPDSIFSCYYQLANSNKRDLPHSSRRYPSSQRVSQVVEE
jgi:hypothetical protein